MTDDPNRKKSLREEVEEYKRRQKEAEDKAASATRQPPGLDEDEDEDEEDEPGDEFAGEDFRREDFDPEKTAAEARASGRGVVRVVSTVFILVGGVLLLVSAALFWITRQSVAAEVSVEGLVVKNVIRPHTTRDANSSSVTTSDYYHAVVEFPLTDGAKKTVEMAEGHWPKAYDEGEKVTVRYDPRQPLKARLGGGTAMDFFASLLTGFLGLVFTSLAIAIRRAFASL